MPGDVKNVICPLISSNPLCFASFLITITEILFKSTSVLLLRVAVYGCAIDNCKRHPAHSVQLIFSGRCLCVLFIQRDSLVLSDGLPGFRGIAAAGIFHKSIVTSGGYGSMKMPAFTWVNVMLGNVKCSLYGTYHAISSRHLPRYLAEFCYRFNRRFNVGSMIHALARIAINSKPIPQH